jgi:hypothetical protein
MQCTGNTENCLQLLAADSLSADIDAHEAAHGGRLLHAATSLCKSYYLDKGGRMKTERSPMMSGPSAETPDVGRVS